MAKSIKPKPILNKFTGKPYNPGDSSKYEASDPRGNPKYVDFRKNDKSGRNKSTIGKKPDGQYSLGTGPRVGGAVTPTATSKVRGTANKGLIKKALGNIKKTAASPQAKKAARRAYGR
jgi:DNA replication initiation complex subunit (GINS family)